MTERLSGEYFKLLGAITSSNLGNGIVLAAFPLIATSITKNPLAISGITAVAGLPWLFVGPVAGAIADRYDRRRLMIVVDLFRAIAMGLLAVYIGFDGEALLVLYVIVLIVGLGEPVVDTSAQALVPKTIPAAILDRANGRFLAAQTIAQRFAGPMLGGLLFSVSGWIPVASDAATFLVAALIVTRLPLRYGHSSDQPDQDRGLLKETLSGLRWLWNQRGIRAFTVGGALLHFVRAAADGILVLVAVERLDLGGMGFAGLLAATGIGYVLGTELAHRAITVLTRWVVATGSILIIGFAFVVIGFTSSGIVAAVSLVGVGTASGIWGVISLSYRLQATPDRLQGRVLAGHLFAAHGAVPLGALAGGVSAEIFGLQGPFFVGAVLVFALAIYIKVEISGMELDPSRMAAVDE